MKKFIFPLCILALSAGAFTSCGDDDDDNNENKDNGSIVINQNLKKLVYASYDEEIVGIKFEYDSKGRLVKAYRGLKDCNEYVYNGNSFTGTSVTVDWNHVISGKLNANGFLETITTQDKNDGKISTTNYYYDKDGHLVKDNTDGGDYSSESVYVWVNGDIVSGTEKYHDEGYDEEERSYSFKYTNEFVTTPIENKARFLFAFPYVETLSDAVSLRNFFGVAGKHLPVSSVDSYGNENNFEWTFDADGYPIKVVDKYQTLCLTWE